MMNSEIKFAIKVRVFLLILHILPIITLPLFTFSDAFTKVALRIAIAMRVEKNICQIKKVIFKMRN